MERRMRDHMKRSETSGNEAGLPDALPGLDVAGGIRRLGGERDFYLEMVAAYLEANRGFEAVIRDFVQKGDFSGARRTAHSLKGAAGNMGAAELQAAAKDIESACADADADRIQGLLPAAAVAMERVADSVERLLALAETAAPLPAIGAYDADALKRSVALLAHSISERDPVHSARHLSEIDAMALPEALAEPVAELSGQVGGYDFDSAAVTLETIRNLLESP